jgi:hypothetical protein
VTLAKLARGDFEYLSPEVIPGYDVYLSFTGGRRCGGSNRSSGRLLRGALYCSVDPDAYPPLDVPKRWTLTYLGTYSDDRQPTLERLLIEPARRLPHMKFAVAGPQYPHTSTGLKTSSASSICRPRNTRNSTPRRATRLTSPRRHDRGRLVAVGAPVRGRRLRNARDFGHMGRARRAVRARRRDRGCAHSDEVVARLSGGADAGAMGRAARARILAGHTAGHRAAELESHLNEACARARADQQQGAYCEA